MNPLPTLLARNFLISLFFLAVLLSGCGKRQRPTIPIQGKVLSIARERNGTETKVPAKGAQVTFYIQNDKHPEPLPLVPATRVKEDGTFQVSTFTVDDGLPEGEYHVTVVWPDYIIEMGQEKSKGNDKLNGRYANKDATPLRASVKKGMPPLLYELQ